MSEQREYVVTLHDKNELDAFYDDMETEGGALYIPDRVVNVAQRRAISRNTHYMLTDEEAQTVKDDPRVLAVSLTPEELGMVVRPSYIQTDTNFDKSPVEDVNDINWGLLRVYESQQRAGWGTDSTSDQSGTINIQTTGKNVDVVIVDGMIDPAHPEYAVNSDGTGGSRVVQYNWFQHNPEVTGGLAGNYVYTPYDNGATDLTDDNSHGSHVAGTTCGNRQGWARRSNIYNINPYGTDVNGVSALNLFDYIRAWHAAKTINPDTGRKNPTVTNNSWGYSFTIPVANITTVNFRGNAVGGPFNNATLRTDYGILAFNSLGTDIAIIPARFAALEADIQDAILDGIIVVGAAGNDYAKMDTAGGIDFNNNIVAGGTYYFHEGSSPSSADDVICVGSIGTVTQDYKSEFSNCGPRVDIFAPGSEIQSSVNTSTSYGGNPDPRDGTNTRYLAKISGTSMASPQVCGVLACALEIYPWMTQAQAREYLFGRAKAAQVGDTGGGFADFTSLQGAANRYLAHYNERPEEGQLYPKKDFWLRDTAAYSKVWPRPRLRRYGT